MPPICIRCGSFGQLAAGRRAYSWAAWAMQSRNPRQHFRRRSGQHWPLFDQRWGDVGRIRTLASICVTGASRSGATRDLTILHTPTSLRCPGSADTSGNPKYPTPGGDGAWDNIGQSRIRAPRLGTSFRRDPPVVWFPETAKVCNPERKPNILYTLSFAGRRCV